MFKQHLLFNCYVAGMHFLMTEFTIFSIIVEFILAMLFMLFSVYNAAQCAEKMSEYGAWWQMDFLLIHKLGTCQECFK